MNEKAKIRKLHFEFYILQLKPKPKPNNEVKMNERFSFEVYE